MSIRRLAATITAARLAKEDAGYQRLLKAVFAPEITVEQINSPQFGQPLIEQLPNPPLHPYFLRLGPRRTRPSGNNHRSPHCVQAG